MIAIIVLIIEFIILAFFNSMDMRNNRWHSDHNDYRIFNCVFRICDF